MIATSGLLISCARPAASMPSEPSRSSRRTCSRERRRSSTSRAFSSAIDAWFERPSISVTSSGRKRRPPRRLSTVIAPSSPSLPNSGATRISSAATSDTHCRTARGVLEQVLAAQRERAAVLEQLDHVARVVDREREPGEARVDLVARVDRRPLERARLRVAQQQVRAVVAEVFAQRGEQQREQPIDLELAREQPGHAVQHRELVQELRALAIERVRLDAADQRGAHVVRVPRLRR